MEKKKQSKSDHWIYERQAQRRFWGNVAQWYGLDQDGVHQLLGIKSMYDWEGSEQEAYETLEEAGPL